jgi:hypothetical protein
MKYELETIPVWDAYKAETECPLCFLEQKIEKNNIQFFLGGSVMEPDIRGKVNDLGFCQVHFHKLFEAGNKLGLALMAHTHLLSLIKTMKRPEKYSHPKTRHEYCLFLKSKKNDCVLCQKLEKTLKRYTFTIVYLWKKDEEFKKTFNTSKGFCLPHFADCSEMADEVLSPKKRERFIGDLYSLQKEHLLRLEEEILWFTQKFDYKNKDKPWKTSKDALQRTIQKLTGKIIE